MKKLILPILLMIGFVFCSAQDVESVIQNTKNRLKSNPFTATGMINLGGNMVYTSLQTNRAYPFSARAQAALNLNFLGVNAPFSLTYGSGGQAFNYTLPSYAFVGLSPSYRWAKLHIGDRSLPLGKYTFSGQSFRGVGVELHPGNWEFSSFYGNIRRATAQDYNSINKIESRFKRYGIGAKTGYKNSKSALFFSFLNAADRTDATYLQDTTGNISPAENLVLSIEGSQKLSKVISFNLAVARSAYSYDKNVEESNQKGILNTFGGVFKPNVSTTWGNAVSGEFLFKTSYGQLSFGYEKVDPGFKTMGSLFFRNDLENVNAGITAFMLKKRWMINSKLGIQRNNLNGDKNKEFNRVVLLLNSSFKLNDKIDFNLQYNTFNNVNRTTTLESISNPLTTNSLVFVNEQLNAGANYMLENTTSANTFLQLQLGSSTGSSIYNDQVQQDEVSTMQFNLFGQRTLLADQSNYGGNISYTSNSIGPTRIGSISVGGNWGKPIKKDKTGVQVFFGGGINHLVDANLNTKSSFINGSLNFYHQIQKDIKLSLNSTYYKGFGEEAVSAFYESRTMLNISYTLKPKA